MTSATSPAPTVLAGVLETAAVDESVRVQDDLFRHVNGAWLARAARLGQPVTARTGRDTRHGTFEGIDDTGALILTTPAGRETIPAADIHFHEA